MKKYKRLEKRVQELEDLQIRVKHLECSGHKWTFVEISHGIFSPRTYYKFKCTECGKEITWPEKWLTGTMRPQLELLGYLESEKKTKKGKN